MKKRIVCTILGILLIAAMPVIAMADYTEGFFEYVLGDNRIEITGYFGSESETTVPARIAGYPVCVIRSGAFSESESLSVVVLPETIMEIQEGAFAPGQSVVYGKSDTGTANQSASDNMTNQEPEPKTESTAAVNASENDMTSTDATQQKQVETASGNSSSVITAGSENVTGYVTMESSSQVETTPAPGFAVSDESRTGSEELELDDQAILAEQERKEETRAAEKEANEAALERQRAEAEARAEEEAAARAAEEAAAAAARERSTTRKRMTVIACLCAGVVVAAVIVVIRRRKK